MTPDSFSSVPVSATFFNDGSNYVGSYSTHNKKPRNKSRIQLQKESRKKNRGK